VPRTICYDDRITRPGPDAAPAKRQRHVADGRGDLSRAQRERLAGEPAAKQVEITGVDDDFVAFAIRPIPRLDAS